ncbi:MAG: hypothetical protein AVDCRST_MAG68-2609, partial [uncultured Gemmatimonadetes bacterium]
EGSRGRQRALRPRTHPPLLPRPGRAPRHQPAAHAEPRVGRV